MRHAPALAGVALAGLLLALTGAEVALRFVPLRERKAHFVSDPVLHHRLRESWQGSVQGHPYRTNALGLRDREIGAKPPDAVRVLMLGDSFTEGGGLADDETIPRRTEAALRATCPAAEVINAGVASYSPILELLSLRKISGAVRPDVVVVNLDMTDVHDDLIRTQLAELDAARLPARVVTDRRRETALVLPPALPHALRPVDDALAHLLLWQSLRKTPAGRRVLGELNLDEPSLAKRGLLGNLRYDRLAITRDTTAMGESAAWDATGRYLAAIHRTAEAANARVLVVAYPYPHQVAAFESPGGRARFGIGAGLYDSDRPFRTVEELGRRHGFGVVSLRETFRRNADPARPLFRPDDVHHTAAGARVMGDAIAAALMERGLLPGCTR